MIFFVLVLTILAETICWSLIAGFIFINGQLRFSPWSSKSNADCWRKVFDFVRYRNYENINSTFHNWRIQKICCINYISSKSFKIRTYKRDIFNYSNCIKKFRIDDDLLNAYLAGQSETYFHNVTYKNIRENTEDNGKSNYLHRFRWYYTDTYRWSKRNKESMPILKEREKEYKTHHQQFYKFCWLIGFAVTYIVIPWVLLSKVVSLIFPFIMMKYANYTNALQQCLFYIFMILLIMVSMMFIFVIRIHYWIWHIFPCKYEPFVLPSSNSNSFCEEIIAYYKDICDCYSIDQLILEKFGANVGQIVLLYRGNMMAEINRCY